MSEFTYTLDGALDQFRAQMHAALPAGVMADRLLSRLLAEAPRAPSVWARDPGVPIPNWASASTVLQHANPASVEAVAVVAGMKNRPALRDLLEAYEAGELPESLYLALLSNPVLSEMNATVRIPHPAEAARWVSPVQMSVITMATLGVALSGRFCYAEKVRISAPEMPAAAENLFDWGLLSQTQERLLRHRLPAFGLVPRQLQGRRDGERGTPRKRSWKEVLLEFAHSPAPPAPLLMDAGPLYDLAVRTVWDPAIDWRLYLRPAGRSVIGRRVGRDLYAVTGDDEAQWSVALDLLDTWEGSLPEWLATVRALA